MSTKTIMTRNAKTTDIPIIIKLTDSPITVKHSLLSFFLSSLILVNKKSKNNQKDYYFENTVLTIVNYRGILWAS